MVRLDFPGGFQGDKENKFSDAARTKQENEAFQYIRQLARYRQQSLPLQIGKTRQYLPSNGLYVFDRTHQKQTVVCILNRSNESKEIPFANYNESFAGFNRAVDIVTGQAFTQAVKVAAGEFKIFELKNK